MDVNMINARPLVSTNTATANSKAPAVTGPQDRVTLNGSVAEKHPLRDLGTWMKNNPSETVGRGFFTAFCAVPGLGAGIDFITGFALGQRDDKWGPYLAGFGGAASNLAGMAALGANMPVLGALGIVGGAAAGLYIIAKGRSFA